MHQYWSSVESRIQSIASPDATVKSRRIDSCYLAVEFAHVVLLTEQTAQLFHKAEKRRRPRPGLR
jgi:hypothetical protein